MGIGAMRCLSQIDLGAPEAFRHAPPCRVVALPLGRVPAIDTDSGREIVGFCAFDGQRRERLVDNPPSHCLDSTMRLLRQHRCK
jgi:hypothetical protein